MKKQAVVGPQTQYQSQCCRNQVGLGRMHDTNSTPHYWRIRSESNQILAWSNDYHNFVDYKNNFSRIVCCFKAVLGQILTTLCKFGLPGMSNWAAGYKVTQNLSARLFLSYFDVFVKIWEEPRQQNAREIRSRTGVEMFLQAHSLVKITMKE